MGDSWLNHCGWWIAALVAIFACLKTLYANPRNKLKVWLQLIVYYAKYWVLWLWIWSLYHLWLEPQAFYVLTLILSLFHLYISWIEPNRLQIRHQTIHLTSPNKPVSSQIINYHQTATDGQSADLSPLVKLAVIGDIHMGIFSTPHQLHHLVKHLNHLEVDAVLVTGDWLYHSGSDIIGQLLVLKALNKPCYSVLSEADYEQLDAINRRYDGSNYMLANECITQVLSTLGIAILGDKVASNSSSITDGKAVMINHLQLIGSSEFGKGLHQYALPMRQSSQPTIILTHDIKSFLANSQHVQHLSENTLVIAGQTHGGQMNIPWLTPWLVKALTGNAAVNGLRLQSITVDMPTANSLITDKKAKTKKVKFYSWTTTGIGMTGLPFRFCCPPRIDVLTIY